MKGTVLLFTLLFVAGCLGCGSGVNVTRFDGTASTMKGVPYNLPMTAFTITVTRHVTGCGDELKGAVEAQIASAKALDPTAMFTLYSDGWLSTSDIKSTYAPDGTSTGLNVSSESAAGTIISNVASVIAAIAPLAAAAGKGITVVDVCKADVSKAVTATKTLQPAVDKETRDVTAATDRVTLLSSQLAVLGNSADKSLKERLVAAMDDLAKKKGTLKVDQDELAKNIGLTSDTQTINWPPDGTQLTAGPLSSQTDLLKKWAKTGAIIHPVEAIKQFDVYLRLERTGPLGVDANKVKTVPQIDISQGVPVRFAVPGRLSVCASGVCGVAGAKQVGKFEGPIMQLGLVYTVPAKGGVFKSETMALSTDANGAPSSVEVVEKVAGVAAATGALKDMATQAAGIPAAINAAKLAKIKAETDQLNAENALATAKAGVDQSVLAPIQAETTLAQAKLAQINADAALKAAQAAQNAAGH